MSETQKQFQIHLPGLLKVLAESLYSSKKVGIRELIQNAHDSCVRRRVEAKEQSYKARVDIELNQAERKIIIQDNGSGLTEEEVTEYLSTIGRSYTRQLGENLAILSPDEASRLVGQFGLGFLSAFLIAEEVTLITRSYKAGAPAIRWRSSGDVHYNLSPVEDAPIGTRVELSVKPESAFLLSERVMVDIVRTYADFLDIPVHVGNDHYPANAMIPPWESVDPESTMREYATRAFGHDEPLAIIPMQDQEINLGHDTIVIPLQGYFIVPPGSMASIMEYGDANIYIRRMFICERHTRLLPSWAKFVRAVIDCPYLQPTASREDIQQDEMFFRVQRALEEQLTSGLRKIAQEEPLKWKQIVRGHHGIILGWASKDDRFFREVMHIVTFRTPDGQKNLPDYLAETDDVIYYVTRAMGSNQDQLLGAGYGVPVIDASLLTEPVFLKKYAQLHPQVRLVRMDGDSNQLFTAVPEQPFLSMLEYFRQQSIRARVVSFKPEAVPAIINYPKDAEFIKETRSALDKGEIPNAFANLVGDYMNNLQVDESQMAGTLYLNASNSLIHTLAGRVASDERDAALELVYQMARLFAARMLDSSDMTQAFKVSSASIQALLGTVKDDPQD